MGGWVVWISGMREVLQMMKTSSKEHLKDQLQLKHTPKPMFLISAIQENKQSLQRTPVAVILVIIVVTVVTDVRFI